MAIPKIFISSTCYDLKQIRNDLYNFIESYGYQAVLSEKNTVPYNTTDDLESDCYAEINNCDIVVGILGGRFGSESRTADGRSVSMREIESAIDNKKQIYIFIEGTVHAEYDTYIINKDKDIAYAHVDNVRIFEFIDRLKRSSSIVISEFYTVQDIIDCLRSQWAGLFQNYLNNKERFRQNEGLTKINETAEQLEKRIEQLDGILKDFDDMAASKYMGRIFLNPVLTKLSRVLLDMPTVILVKNKKSLDEFLGKLGYEEVGYDVDRGVWSYVDGQTRFMVDNGIFEEDGHIRYMSTKQIKDYEEERQIEIFSRDAIEPMDVTQEEPVANMFEEDELPF